MPKKVATVAPKPHMPAIISQLIDAKKIFDRAEEFFNKLKERSREILRVSSFDEVKLTTIAGKEVLNPQKSLEWLDKQLADGKIDEEFYDSFFVKVIDMSLVESAVQKKKLSRKDLKDAGAYIKTKDSERINFYIKENLR